MSYDRLSVANQGVVHIVPTGSSKPTKSWVAGHVFALALGAERRLQDTDFLTVGQRIVERFDTLEVFAQGVS